MTRQFLIFFFCLNISTLFGQTKVSVKIDPRFEAISIFHTLATADSFEKKDQPTPSIYYKDLKEYFKIYKNNPALEWYRKLNQWDGYDIASFGIYLSNGFPFKIENSVETNYIKSATQSVFLNKFNTFYKTAHVEKFITQHRPFYNQVCKYAEDSILRSNILNDVKSFFGNSKNAEFIIYLDLLNNQGNNAIILKNKKFKGQRIQRLAYLSDTTDNLTDANPVVFNPYLNVVAHECSHFYVNDFIPNFKNRLFKIRNIFLETSKGEKLEEKEWVNELDELLVRVCVAKILEIKFGNQAGTDEINMQAKYYKLAKDLYNYFDIFIGDRKKYKTLKDFYPKILEFLESKS